MRSLAPAGGFPTIGAAFRASLDPELFQSIERVLRSLYNGQPISLCSSGKQAIEIISRYLVSKGYKNLLLGAYGCPDIVAAALKGGFRVKLVDVNPRTLEPNFGDFNAQENVVFLSNLYGLVDSTVGLGRYKLIDDACQAALSFEGVNRVGSRGLGVLSFGRGKAACAVGGGAIIGFGETPEVISEKLFSLTRLLAYSILENPSLYSIFSSLPFLKLGETRFQPDYSDTPLSTGKVAAALTAICNFEQEVKSKLATQELWIKSLAGLNVVLPVSERGRESSAAVLTRFPVLVPNNRDRIFSELSKAGLGASISYHTPLDKLCHLDVDCNLDGASCVASQIITLPTHRYVKQSDILKVSEIIKKYA